MKIICKLTRYAYQNRAGKDLSQDDQVIRFFNSLRESYQSPVPDNEFFDDAASLRCVSASVNPPEINHQKLELSTQMQSDTDKEPLGTAIPGVRNEQLDHLVERHEDVLDVGDGFEETGRR